MTNGMRIGTLFLVATLTMLCGIAVAQAQSITRVPDTFEWSPFTLVMCWLGWLAHLVLSWGERWKRDRVGLTRYIEDDTPSFLLSVVCLPIAYVALPEVLRFFGIDATFNNFGAFAAGYMADSVAYKLAGIAKKEDV